MFMLQPCIFPMTRELLHPLIQHSYWKALKKHHVTDGFFFLSEYTNTNPTIQVSLKSAPTTLQYKVYRGL